MDKFISPFCRLRKYKDDFSTHLLQTCVVISWDKMDFPGWMDWQGGGMKQHSSTLKTQHTVHTNTMRQAGSWGMQSFE